MADGSIQEPAHSIHTANTSMVSSAYSRAFDRATGSGSALILSHSASLRDSLQVLLGAVPQLEHIHQAGDSLEALSLDIPTSPDIVLYDLDMRREGARSALGHIKDRWPHSRCLALVEDETLAPEAHVAGADVVLLKGIRAARLLDTLKELVGENV